MYSKFLRPCVWCSCSPICSETTKRKHRVIFRCRLLLSSPFFFSLFYFDGKVKNCVSRLSFSKRFVASFFLLSLDNGAGMCISCFSAFHNNKKKKDLREMTVRSNFHMQVLCCCCFFLLSIYLTAIYWIFKVPSFFFLYLYLILFFFILSIFFSVRFVCIFLPWLQRCPKYHVLYNCHAMRCTYITFIVRESFLFAFLCWAWQFSLQCHSYFI